MIFSFDSLKTAFQSLKKRKLTLKKALPEAEAFRDKVLEAYSPGMHFVTGDTRDSFTLTYTDKKIVAGFDVDHGGGEAAVYLEYGTIYIEPYHIVRDAIALYAPRIKKRMDEEIAEKVHV